MSALVAVQCAGLKAFPASVETGYALRKCAKIKAQIGSGDSRIARTYLGSAPPVCNRFTEISPNSGLGAFAQSGIEFPNKCATLCLRIEHLRKHYAPPINDYLASMFEVYRYPFANIRLHLAKPPIRPIRVPHHHAGLKE
jgi:hypothetical protein